MKTIAVFNVRGGVGKTTLVYHLAWMYADLGLRVIAADLDPQANLTSMFVGGNRLECLWSEDGRRSTVYGAIQPLLEGTSGVVPPHVEAVGERIGLLAGDLALSGCEDGLNREWAKAMDRDARTLQVISAFWRTIEAAAHEYKADLVLIDLAPSIGAISHAALIAAEHVVFPLVPDVFAAEGLKHAGPRLRRWRAEWRELRSRNTVPDLSLPGGEMKPAGYVVLRHAVRLGSPPRDADHWIQRIPGAYHESVLGEPPAGAPPSVYDDPQCLATLKHYRSLMPLAQEAGKPMFFLRAADGAIGGHAKAVLDCYNDFNALALKIAERCDVAVALAGSS